MSTFIYRASALLDSIVKKREGEIVVQQQRYFFSRRKRSRQWRLHRVLTLEMGKNFPGLLLHPPGSKNLEGEMLGLIPEYTDFPRCPSSHSSISGKRRRCDLHTEIPLLVSLLGQLLDAATLFGANQLISGIKQFSPGTSEQQNCKYLLVYRPDTKVRPCVTEVRGKLEMLQSAATKTGAWAIQVGGVEAILSRVDDTTQWKLSELMLSKKQTPHLADRLLFRRSSTELFAEAEDTTLGISFSSDTAAETGSEADYQMPIVLARKTLNAELDLLANTIRLLKEELRYILAGHYSGLPSTPPRSNLLQAAQAAEVILDALGRPNSRFKFWC